MSNTFRSPVHGAGGLVAAAVVLMGFVPTDSVVLMIREGGDSRRVRCAARTDRGDMDGLAQAVAALTRDDHAPEYGALVVFGGSAEEARQTRADVSGSVVVEMLVLTDLTHAWCLCADEDCADQRVEVALDSHPLVAEAVVAGRGPLSSREDYAALCRPASARPGHVLDADRIVAAMPVSRLPRTRLLEAGRVFASLIDGSTCTDDDLCLLLSASLVVPARDYLWALIDRHNAAQAVEVWSRATTRCPARLAAAPLALTGFAAWVHGNGARANIALDMALNIDPDHRLAQLVSMAACSGADPHRWEGPSPAEVLDQAVERLMANEVSTAG